MINKNWTAQERYLMTERIEHAKMELRRPLMPFEVFAIDEIQRLIATARPGFLNVPENAKKIEDSIVALETGAPIPW